MTAVAERPQDRRGDIQLGLIGFGRWGKNWGRVLDDEGVLAWIRDDDPDRMEEAARVHGADKVAYQGAETFPADGVVIATPASTHYQLAREQLLMGRHVLVEKPVATKGRQVTELRRLANERDLAVVVGHTFLYSEPLFRVFRWINDGEIGAVRHIRMEWTNRGTVREDCDVLWNVGPHPASVLLRIAGTPPSGVQAASGAWLAPDRADVNHAWLEWGSGVSAQWSLSWLDPEKTRRITVLGERGEIVCEPTEGRTDLYTQDGEKVERSFALGREPLSVELLDFLIAIERGQPPMSGLGLAHQVTRLLQRVESAARSPANSTRGLLDMPTGLQG